MFIFLMIGLFVASFALSNSRPRLASALAFSSGFVILLFRVIPGNAIFLDWIIMALLIITAGLLFMIVELTEKKRTWRTYLRSLRATFSGKIN